MRSVLLIFATIIVIGAGFFAYLWFQPASQTNAPTAPGVPAAIAPATRPVEVPDPDRAAGGGTSEKVWVKTRDEKTGELASEFRAERLDPKKDGTVDVVEPEAKFYLGEREPRQVLVIRGQTGTVVIPESANKRTPQMKGAGGMPSRGHLQDVTLMLFETSQAAEPSMTCTMNNASFDQEAFRIQTESYEHNGKIIPADQVAVHVVGRDYDFDGRGLDIRWNERDRRLQQLQIEHGEKLVVKHPQAIRSFAGPTTEPSARINSPLPLAASRIEPSEFATPQAAEPILLAATDPKAAGDAIPAPAPPTRKKKKPAPAIPPVKIQRDKSAPLFRASFFEHVKILEGDATLATADQMHVDFVMEAAKRGTTQPGTNPSSAPATQPAQQSDSSEPKSLANVTRTARKPSTEPRKRPAEHRPTTGPGATTQPVEQPLTIVWTGKLTVIPIDPTKTEDPPSRDNAIVTLQGEPVVLTRTGGRVEAARVRYRTEDSSLLVDHSQATPIVMMSDANGSVLRTPKLTYDGTEGIAMLEGASKADLVMKSESTTQPTTQPTVVHASWSKSCQLDLMGETRETMSIESADIQGDVTIDDPRIRGRSDRLELAFDQVPTTKPSRDPANGPSTEPQLRTLIATGGTHYVLTNEQKQQTIDCSILTLDTAADANHKLYARNVKCDGEVHAFDDQQDLRCGTLALKLLPSTQPSTKPADASGIDTASVVVEDVSADKDVRISTKDGSLATADRLTMATKDGKREVTLTGQPAHVKQKENELAGPVIQIDPDTNRASVVGAGTMHALQEPSARSKDKKPQPIDIKWAKNLAADGNANTVDITDKVEIAAKTADGANNKANGDRLKLILMDDPKAATRPATQKAKKDSPLAHAGFGDSDFFKDKLVRTVILQDNVAVSSRLDDDSGNLLRRMYMQAPMLQYEMQDHIFLVPAAGQMLMQDVTKPDKAAQEIAAGDTTSGDLRGATAFEWGKELRYDEGQRRVTLSGGVHIEHDSGGDNKPFSLRGETILADLEPVPTTQPATKETAQNEKMRLKHVKITGDVEFISLPVHFESSSIDYDPNTHILVAKGTDRVRAQLYDEKGTLAGSFTQLRYNTQTGRIEKTEDLRATLRK